MKKMILPAFIFASGVVMGFLATAYMPESQAGKPDRIDIIYKIVAQNYYLTQKNAAYEKYNSDLLMMMAEKSKVKMEQILPLTNKLQQEAFALDLQIKELNQ